MNLIYHLLHKSYDRREDVISVTSGLNIAINILVSLMKVIIGMMASSIAIISEGFNNATDALTSVLTLIGTKLAGKHPDEKHPFGYGRIEYLTGLVVATLIMVAGIEMLISSVKLIFEPEELNISVLSLVIVAVSAVIKLFLGLYTIRMGKKADSSALSAVGLDCRNDCFASVVTIASALIFLVFRFSVDAWAGIFTSLLILKAGVGVLMETVSELLGRPGEKEMASQLYREIRSTKGVLNAADMMLHNYGPDAWSGSVNIEMDHNHTVGEVYEILHDLQLRIMQEHHVVMVFGIYAVDNDRPQVREIREKVAKFVSAAEHVKSYHAVYLDPSSDRLYCDLVVDYDLKDWKALEESFTAYMKQNWPEKQLMLTIETEFV